LPAQAFLVSYHAVLGRCQGRNATNRWAIDRQSNAQKCGKVPEVLEHRTAVVAEADQLGVEERCRRADRPPRRGRATEGLVDVAVPRNETRLAVSAARVLSASVWTDTYRSAFRNARRKHAAEAT